MRFDANGQPVDVPDVEDRDRARPGLLTATFITALLGAGMGLAFYGLGSLSAPVERDVDTSTLQPTPLPTLVPDASVLHAVETVAAMIGTLQPTATSTPRPTSTPDPDVPTPDVQPTATPFSVCGPWVPPGDLCMMPEPAPTQDDLPEQP